MYMCVFIYIYISVCVYVMGPFSCWRTKIYSMSCISELYITFLPYHSYIFLCHSQELG